jgi:hypothetical protein
VIDSPTHVHREGGHDLADRFALNLKLRATADEQIDGPGHTPSFLVVL